MEPLTYKEQLLTDIRQAVCTLDSVFIQLNSNTDPDLIDCYIYELKAAKKDTNIYKNKPEKTASQIIPKYTKTGYVVTFSHNLFY